MREDQFFICEEDNIFDTLSALYEEVKPCPYATAPGLDPDLEWEEEINYIDLPTEDTLEIDEAYGTDSIDFQRGDILLASVYQYGENTNPEHKVRPFLVIYSNAYRAYGFQLSTSHPNSLLNYRVEVPNYQDCGLERPCAFMVNMIRGVDLQRLIARIGHITEVQKQALLNKLSDIKENKDGLYTDCMHADKIDLTISNIEKIYC
jgi:mRNA-degrading endonuclease toxin of MazEF toxin-antitoxin module